MKKNIIIACLALIIVIILLWPQRPEVPDKPEVHVFLPDDYCGEFVVFWGENTAPIDEPPAYLSYNYYPEHPNAVLINLPAPYKRAGLQFIYQNQDGTIGRNPIFRMTGVTGVRLDGGVEVLENGHTQSLPGIDLDVGVEIFTLTQSVDCTNNFNTSRLSRISELYLSLVGQQE